MCLLRTLHLNMLINAAKCEICRQVFCLFVIGTDLEKCNISSLAHQ